MHSLNWDITSEYNLDINAQELDFILFKNSVWQKKELSSFEDGTSFTINFLTLSGDDLMLFALSKYFITRRYRLRNDGFISGLDLDLQPFAVTVNNVAVFLNGKFVKPTCYTVTDSTIRFHIKNERDSSTESGYKDYTSWQEGDIVSILTNNPEDLEQSFHSYYLEYTSNQAANVISQNGKHFRSVQTPLIKKGKTVVLVNGEIIPYTSLTFPGGEFDSNSEYAGALVIKRNLTEADKVEIFSFDKGFEYFEYKPSSGQTRFKGPDRYGNFLSYSAEQGAGIAQLFEFTTNNSGDLVRVGAPWSNITGVRKGYKIHASCIYNGESFNGVAEIQDDNMDKSSVSVKIISDFGRAEFDSSEWYMTPPESKSIVSYLDPRTLDTVAIPEILKSFQGFFLDHFQEGLTRLTTLRNVNEVEPQLLTTTLDMLGMRLDMSEMSELNKRRAVKEVINFYKRCGTKQSINFLGYINNKVINMEDALWTDDYIHFSTPEELGATYARKQLAQFIDYRFIAATAVATDDYGDCLDLKKPFKLIVEADKITLPYGSRAFFPNHYTGTEGSMKWNLINEKLSITTQDYPSGDMYLIVVDDHGSQTLDLVSNIPTSTKDEVDPSKCDYYYNYTYNSINSVDNLEVSVSAPLAKVNIDVNTFEFTLLQTYTTCSFIDEYVFVMTSEPIIDAITGARSQTGLSYWYKYLDQEGFVVNKKAELSRSQVFTIRQATGKNYVAFFSKTGDQSELNKAKMDYIPQQYYTRTGLQPEVANKALWKRGNTWYVYDNYASGIDKYEYDLTTEGDIVRDEKGLALINYVFKDGWYKNVFIGDFEELPSCKFEDEILSIPDTFYAFVNNDSDRNIIYTLSAYPYVGETIYKIANAEYIFGTVDSVDSENRTVTVNDVVYTYSPNDNVSGRPLCRLDGVYYSFIKRETYECDEGHMYTNGIDSVYTLTDMVRVGDLAYSYDEEKELRHTWVITSQIQNINQISVCPREYVGTPEEEAHTKSYTKVMVYSEDIGGYTDVLAYKYYFTYERASSWSEITRYFTDYSVLYDVTAEELNKKTLYRCDYVSGVEKDLYIQTTSMDAGSSVYTRDGDMFERFGVVKLRFSNNITFTPYEFFKLVDASSGDYVLKLQDCVDPTQMSVKINDRPWNLLTVETHKSTAAHNVSLCYVFENGVDDHVVIEEYQSGSSITYTANVNGVVKVLLTIEEGDENFYYIFEYNKTFRVSSSPIELTEAERDKKSFEFFGTSSSSNNAYVVLLYKNPDVDTSWRVCFGNGIYGAVPLDNTVMELFYGECNYTINTEETYQGRVFDVVEGRHDQWIRYSVHLLSKEEITPTYIAYEVLGESGHLKPFIPYFNQEIYYDSTKMKHYQFYNGGWVEVYMAVVGEFNRAGKTIESDRNYIDEFVASEKVGKRYYLSHQSLINEKSLSIIVDDVEWTVILENLDGEAPDSRVALFTRDSADQWYVIFGDDEHGKKPETGWSIKVKYSTYEFPVMDKFLPYEKRYTNFHKSEHKIGYKYVKYVGWVKDTEKEDPIPTTGYRYDDFRNAGSIDTTSMSVFVNKEKWRIVSDRSKYDSNAKIAEIKRSNTKTGAFVFVLFGNGIHGQALREGDLISVYYKDNKEDYINNIWYMNGSTFIHSLETRVAYDYGLITQTKESDWVYYRQFDPPVGYYPTNHVRYNIDARGVVDAKNFEEESRYQFYELASTPWCLENICSIIAFQDLYVGIGAAQQCVGNLFFRATEEMGSVSLNLGGRQVNMSGLNMSDTDDIFVIRNGALGQIQNIDKIKFIIKAKDEEGSIADYLVYTTVDDVYNKKATLVRDIDRVKPNNSFSFEEGDVLYAVQGTVVSVSIQAEDRDPILMPLTFSNINPPFEVKGFSKDCTLKVNVNTLNDRPEDKVEIYIAEKKNIEGKISLKMFEDSDCYVDLVVKQRGCIEYSENLHLTFDMFDNEASTFNKEVNLELKDITIVAYAPDSSCVIVANDVEYETPVKLTVKYGTSMTVYARSDKYIPATESQIKNFIALSDVAYYLELDKKHYALNVTTTVNGQLDSNQPIYLNGLVNTTRKIWDLGQEVDIVAGGQINVSQVVSRKVTISETESENVYVIECPPIDEAYID